VLVDRGVLRDEDRKGGVQVSPLRQAGVSGNGRLTGSGPDGRITAEDIRRKAQELVAGVEGQVSSRMPLLTYAAAGAVAAALVAAFLLGRRSGRRRSTVVEIRRV
jgi:pyruvate/2-oxoglutarate dehydrogenase complex dihydrolipoamide acyltransferase (E2) component